MSQLLSKSLEKAWQKFFKDFEWIHVTLGILGNLTFFVGSIFFFYESLKTPGIWLFVIGSLLMLIGAIGDGLVKYVNRRQRYKNNHSE